MGTIIAGVGSKLVTTVLSEKVVKMIIGKLGDYLVKSTKNTLDDELWAEVKKVLS
jgi:hypothetical protein|tara:strand:- start:246 stop:410 length:165 start_codon:yes stop_codon:yes gene_type:complete